MIETRVQTTGLSVVPLSVVPVFGINNTLTSHQSRVKSFGLFVAVSILHVQRRPSFGILVQLPAQPSTIYEFMFQKMNERLVCDVQPPATYSMTKVAGFAADEDETLAVDVFSRRMPPNASDPEAVDSLIATQMAKLSVQDREKVYMDIHGIPDYVVETPELIQLSLLDLQSEIQLLPDKQAYKLAESLDSNYVHDRDFCLAFLRCEKFDCPKAALRVVRHFHMKLDLFGKEKLVKDITQDDLGSEEMDAVYGSGGRYLNTFDSGGRAINFLDGMVHKNYKTDVVVSWCVRILYL